MAHADGKAQIQHADTGKIYEIDGAYLVFKVVLKHKRIMGIEKTYSAELDHPQLGKLTWKVWEYPLGKIKKSDFDVNRHTLMKNINFTPDDGLAEDDEERQRKIDAMIEWFHATYEDPQNSLSYDKDDEYGYVWSRGGPCDASYELQENFPDEDYDIIEAAVEKIQDGGTVVWSPINDPEEHDDELLIGDNLKDIEDAFNTLTDNAPPPTTDPAFAFDEGNRLHIIPPPDNQPVDSQDDLLNELRTITDDMLQSLRGSNAHQELIPIIEQYKEALSGNQISISRLYGRGVRLDKMVRAINRGIEAKELPSLPINTETYLESALEIHGAYIMSDAKGRNLVQDAADYHQPPEQPEGFKEAVEQFSNNIKNNSALFDERVREYVPNILMDIGKGEHSKRLNQIGETTLTKFVSALFKGIRKVGGKAIQWIAVHAVVKSTPGQIAITAGTDFINTVWGFLINNAPSLKTITDYLSSESSWLESASNILARIISMIMGD